MKWREALTNADIDLTLHARKNGKAKLKVWYYGDRNGTVRKVIERHPLTTDEYFDRGADED